MGFTATVVTSVQNRCFSDLKGQPMALGTLMTYLQAIDVIEQVVTNTGSGVSGIQTGGSPLTNQQYQELYEMLF